MSRTRRGEDYNKPLELSLTGVFLRECSGYSGHYKFVVECERNNKNGKPIFYKLSFPGLDRGTMSCMITKMKEAVRKDVEDSRSLGRQFNVVQE